jgi:hypothetical protein
MSIPYASMPPDQPRPKASGLGIASLVLGLVSMCGSWIPCCGIGTYPVAGVGFILGLVGLLVAISNHGSRAPLGFPIAGICVCLVSFLMPFLVPLLLVGAGSALAPPPPVPPNPQVAQPPAQVPTPSFVPGAPSSAVVAAKARLEAAKAACIMRLKITDAYSAAAVDTQNKLNRLNDAKASGDQDAIARASTAYIQAKELLRRMEIDAYSGDPQVVAAQKELDSLTH